MKVIRIVKNPDRCHVSVNDMPEQTFIYCSYPHKSEEQNAAHALQDAKAECFNQLAKFQREKIKAVIETKIETL